MAGPGFLRHVAGLPGHPASRALASGLACFEPQAPSGHGRRGQAAQTWLFFRTAATRGEPRPKSAYGYARFNYHYYFDVLVCLASPAIRFQRLFSVQPEVRKERPDAGQALTNVSEAP
jgi:hypothetical protein